MVVNHWEDYASNNELNYNQLCTDFPNLLGSITVSAKCASQIEFDGLTEKIIDMASKLDSTSMEFPVQWDHIRQELMQMAGGSKPGSTNVSWATLSGRTFLRFTLIEFPKGVVTDLNSDDYSTWHTVGTPLNIM